MRNAPTKLLFTVALAGLGVLTATGCGNDVPPNAVATVGDTTIKKADFDKWLKTAQASASQGAAPVSYEPPDYTACVAAKKKQPTTGKKQTEAQLKKACKTEFDQLKKQVMQFLIQAEWVEQEADKRDIKITTAQVEKSFADQKKQAFPTDKAYQQFLKTSGMSEKDILFRVRLDQLQQKLTQKVTEGETKVSDEDISDYYDKNEKRFAQPERRELLVVLTKSKAKADQAKQALESGQNWKAVAKQYSIDQASKAQGGKLPGGVAKGQLEKSLDTAVFSAKKSVVSGPVKTQFGYYVFKVTKITAASQQSLAQAKEMIKSQLKQQKQQKALDDFIKDFRDQYKDKTDCADDYKVTECSNGPDEKTNTTPASGGSPSGAQQAPPGSQPAPSTPQGEQPKQ